MKLKKCKLQSEILSSLSVAKDLNLQGCHTVIWWVVSDVSKPWRALPWTCCQSLKLYSIGDRWMNMTHWWNNNDGQTEVLEVKPVHQCLLVHHKSHMDWPEIEPWPMWLRSTTNCLSHGMAEKCMECDYIHVLCFHYMVQDIIHYVWPSHSSFGLWCHHHYMLPP
jgi:hypothetical protein